MMDSLELRPARRNALAAGIAEMAGGALLADESSPTSAVGATTTAPTPQLAIWRNSTPAAVAAVRRCGDTGWGPGARKTRRLRFPRTCIDVPPTKPCAARGTTAILSRSVTQRHGPLARSFVAGGTTLV